MCALAHRGAPSWHSALTLRVSFAATPPLTTDELLELRAALVRQLLKASLTDSVALADEALTKGADANLVNHDGASNTPLHYAASQGAVRVAYRLFLAGALPDARNKYNYTPLHRACSLGKASAAALLLAVNADPDLRSPVRGVCLCLCLCL